MSSIGRYAFASRANSGHHAPLTRNFSMPNNFMQISFNLCLWKWNLQPHTSEDYFWLMIYQSFHSADVEGAHWEAFIVEYISGFLRIEIFLAAPKAMFLIQLAIAASWWHFNCIRIRVSNTAKLATWSNLLFGDSRCCPDAWSSSNCGYLSSQCWVTVSICFTAIHHVCSAA